MSRKELNPQKKYPTVRKPSVFVFILGGIIWGLLHILFILHLDQHLKIYVIHLKNMKIKI